MTRKIMAAVIPGLVVALAAMGLAGTATAQEPDRIQKLLDTVKRLENRVNELERDAADGVNPLESSINAIADSIESPALATDLPSHWSKGLRFGDKKGDFNMKVGGRVQLDLIFGLDQDDALTANKSDNDDTVEFRRARLYMSGTIHEHVIWKAQYDLSGGIIVFKDVFIGLKGVPVVGTILVGQFKQPFGLEELTSSKYISFMERSTLDIFTPAREVGLGIQNAFGGDKRIQFGASIYRDVDIAGDLEQKDEASDGDYNFAMRVSGLPIWEDDGATLLHLGFAFNWRNPNSDYDAGEPNQVGRWRARPGIHTGNRFVDTGSFDADNIFNLGAEAALVLGSFSFQTEFVYSITDPEASGAPDPTFWAVYGYASYFLTGEHRRYKNAVGYFDRVIPNQNFWDGDGGAGAWELLARFDYIDLTDSGITGGEMWTITFGVNWYLNPNTRVMVNYVFADVDEGPLLASSEDANAHFLGIRVQIDF